MAGCFTPPCKLNGQQANPHLHVQLTEPYLSPVGDTMSSRIRVNPKRSSTELSTIPAAAQAAAAETAPARLGSDAAICGADTFKETG